MRAQFPFRRRLASLAVGLAATFVILAPSSTLRAEEKMAHKSSAEAEAKLKRMYDYIRGAPELSFDTDISVNNRLVRGKTTRAKAGFQLRADSFRVDAAVNDRRYVAVSDGKVLTIARPSVGKYALYPAKSSALETMYTVVGLINISGQMLDFFGQRGPAPIALSLIFQRCRSVTDGALASE